MNANTIRAGEDGTGPKERVTVRLPPAVVDQLEQVVDAGVYQNRSAAIREALRNHLLFEPGGPFDVGGDDE